MKPLPGYIISLPFLLLSLSGIAQDSLQSEMSGISVNIVADYGKLIESLFNKQSKWEFGVDVQFLPNYKVVTEYGFGSLNPESAIINGSYNSEGNYFRVGLEYIFILNSSRYLSTGFMYGKSQFGDMASVQIVSEFWQSIDFVADRNNLSADWIEWVLNTEGPIFNAISGPLSNLFWGMKFRIRFLVTDLSRQEIDILAVPGYGKGYSNVVPAANLFLKYRIDF